MVLTRSQLNTALADNTAGQITALTMRNWVQSTLLTSEMSLPLAAGTVADVNLGTFSLTNCQHVVGMGGYGIDASTADIVAIGDILNTQSNTNLVIQDTQFNFLNGNINMSAPYVITIGDVTYGYNEIFFASGGIITETGLGGLSITTANGSGGIISNPNFSITIGDTASIQMPVDMNNNNISGVNTIHFSSGGNFTTAGAFAVTLTATGATNVTLPTSGTLITTSGNAATATALQMARSINGVNFDGTGNIVLPSGLFAHVATTAALPACTYANGTSGVGATLTKTSNGALTVDGLAVALNQIVLVNNQASSFQNGLYIQTQLGSGSVKWILTRATTMNVPSQFFGATIAIGSLGLQNASTTWEFTSANTGMSLTIGTDAISFIRISNPAAVVETIHTDGTVTAWQTANTDAAAGTAIMSAITAAVSGDTIYVYRNATITGNLAKNGVNWWFAPGVIITLAITTEGYIFSDDPTGGGTGAACSYTVGGGGKFVRNGTGMDVSGGSGNLAVVGVLAVVNSASAVTFEFDQMVWTYTGTPADVGVASVVKHWNGSLTLKGNLLLGASDPVDTSGNNVTTVLGWYTGEFNGEIGQIIYTGDTTVAGAGKCIDFGPNSASLNQTFRLTCETIQVVATQTTSIPSSVYVISMEETTAGNAVWITAKTVYGGIHLIGGGKLYMDCQKLFGFVIVDQQDSDSESHLTIEKIGGNFGAATDAIRILNTSANANTSKSWISVRTFDAGTNWANLINQSAGILWFNGSDITAASGQDAILVSGGTANIISGLISTGGGHNDLKQTGGTLKVTAAVEYDATKTTGTITKAKIFGNTPGTSSGTLV